jgi:DNA-binding response OmpR family regulator
MGGYGRLKDEKNDQKLTNVYFRPIMAVSANARSEQVLQAKEAGMDDAISKPFRIAELLAKLDALPGVICKER